MWILWSLPGYSITEMGNEVVASLCAPETTGGKHKEWLCLESGQQALHGCVVVVVGSLPSGNTLQDFLGPLKFPRTSKLCSSFSSWQLMGAWPERPSSSWPWGISPTPLTTNTPASGAHIPLLGHIC